MHNQTGDFGVGIQRQVRGPLTPVIGIPIQAASVGGFFPISQLAQALHAS